MPVTRPLTALLIEDDAADALLFEAALDVDGGLPELELVFASTLAEGQRQLAGRQVDLVLLDLHLPDAQGMDGLDAIVADHPQVPVIVLTGMTEGSVGEQALHQGAQDFLIKGDDRGRALRTRIGLAVQRHGLQLESIASRELYERRARQLEEANEQLQSISRLRDQLIEVVSHELRTPLTPILGFAELLGRLPAMPDDAVMMSHAIERNAKRLMRRVDELLTVGRARKDRLVVERGPVELRSVLDDVLGDLNGLVDEVSLTGVIDTTVVVDRGHLERILDNLLRNAMKYGCPPFEVDASLEEGRLLIAVTDRGEGIPEAFIASMWDPFSQSDHRGSSPSTGVGLGLTVVKLLAGANDIEVAYDTTESGARFRLWIPTPAEVVHPVGRSADEIDDDRADPVEMSGTPRAR